MALTIEPAAAAVPASGGVSTHQFQNPGEQRLVFKVRATNNDNYRVKPVYGFVEPGASTAFEVTRTAGPPKEDKFVVQFAAASPEEASPENAFKATSPLGQVSVLTTFSHASSTGVAINNFVVKNEKAKKEMTKKKSTKKNEKKKREDDDEDTSSDEEEEKKKRLVCPYRSCRFEADRMDHIQSHIRRVHLVRRYRCSICRRTFDTMLARRGHNCANPLYVRRGRR